MNLLNLRKFFFFPFLTSVKKIKHINYLFLVANEIKNGRKRFPFKRFENIMFRIMRYRYSQKKDKIKIESLLMKNVLPEVKLKTSRNLFFFLHSFHLFLFFIGYFSLKFVYSIWNFIFFFSSRVS